MAVSDNDRLSIREPTERELRALDLVGEQPGITVAELGEALDVSPARGRKIVERLRGYLAVRPAPLSEPADLEPEISIRELPSPVAAARERSRREDQRLSALVEPRIAGHIATYGMAVDAVERLHQQIADRTDIDLSGATRWAAMWLLSGRSIGFGRALIVLARSGIGDEALPTARAMHESVRLLEAVSNGRDRQLVTRWLEDDDGRHVRPREVRAANEAAETLVAEAMIAAGEQPLPSTRELSDKLYHRMSVVTHNRRQAIDLVVASNLRRMARGRHPNPVGRARPFSRSARSSKRRSGKRADACRCSSGPR